MAVPNYENLGGNVTTRVVSFADLAHRAWGAEWAAPDHGIYEFGDGRRKFDSTDRGRTGIYGIVGDNVLLLDGTQYPDMRDSIIIAIGVNPFTVLPAGSFQELSQDPTA